MLKKIMSGGQTGADRAALDVALEHGFEIGGWVPKGRLAEDGPIPHSYGSLFEADSTDPSVRTILNVRDSDATLIVSHGSLQGGSLLALQESLKLGRTVLHVDLLAVPKAAATSRVLEWLRAVDPLTLNVAGPRSSQDAAIYQSVSELLRAVLPLVSRSS